ncbi:hypothetical protein [Paenibacillus piri]|uniref:Uncharacterized protein n=1 Tax=Paenibacillus piri TaxID=2547395 RepID=A0A4R5KUR9_9BACL|nr:hypothetical protein [Paenibacillus piri]TDF99661.1 hypothetical protein E1757_07480 [Paenibacillus piri]
MRTENQIKRKLNELLMQKKSLEDRMADLPGSEQAQDDSAKAALRLQAEQLEQSILLLEWVLDEPVGKYHV